MTGGEFSRRQLIAGTLALSAGAALPAPLFAAPVPPAVRRFDLRGPDGRTIEISEWQPRSRPRGTILFSHGAMSAPRFYEAIIAPWQAAGYRVLAPLHVDSSQHPDTAKYAGLASWKARIEDMRALSAHLGNRPWIAAGHSYGGLVALTMGGAAAIAPQGITGPLSDANVHAVVAFSPPAPIPVLCTAQGFAALKVPALIQTGTADDPPGPDGWEGHLASYEAAAPGGQRFGLVLEGVDHYFGGAICRYDVPGPKQLARLQDANRIARLFLAGYGTGRASARRALERAVTNALPAKLLHK
jgi:pimeloyl-ACP methyl ester carboxylesterase